MGFFDCNVQLGLPIEGRLAPVATPRELLLEMDRAGVERALVWHCAQLEAAPQVGNQLLSEAIAQEPRLVGCWAVMPDHDEEFPPLGTFLARMKEARVAALRAFPGRHDFLLNAVSTGELLSAMTARRIPLILSLERGADWRTIYELLGEFPDLVCILCDVGWPGQDRMVRPLLRRYPHVYVDTANYTVDGGVESLVSHCGAHRLLFGSDFPDSYFGGMMLAIQHADVPAEAKAAIAGGNLARILGEAAL